MISPNVLKLLTSHSQLHDHSKRKRAPCWQLQTRAWLLNISAYFDHAWSWAQHSWGFKKDPYSTVLVQDKMLATWSFLEFILIQFEMHWGIYYLHIHLGRSPAKFKIWKCRVCKSESHSMIGRHVYLGFNRADFPKIQWPMSMSNPWEFFQK